MFKRSGMIAVAALMTGLSVSAAQAGALPFSLEPDAPLLAFVAEDVASLQEEIKVLQLENRKLALALADATQRLIDMRERATGVGGVCKDKNLNVESCDEALEMIGVLKKENGELLGLKDTLHEMQAQNEHLSAAGNFGKTAQQQILAAQQKNFELEDEIKKEKKNSDVYKRKIKDYELEIAALREGTKEVSCPAPDSQSAGGLEAENTKLRLEVQDLKAQLELISQKSAVTP